MAESDFNLGFLIPKLLPLTDSIYTSYTDFD